MCSVIAILIYMSVCVLKTTPAPQRDSCFWCFSRCILAECGGVVENALLPITHLSTNMYKSLYICREEDREIMY